MAVFDRLQQTELEALADVLCVVGVAMSGLCGPNVLALLVVPNLLCFFREAGTPNSRAGQLRELLVNTYLFSRLIMFCYQVTQVVRYFYLKFSCDFPRLCASGYAGYLDRKRHARYVAKAYLKDFWYESSWFSDDDWAIACVWLGCSLPLATIVAEHGARIGNESYTYTGFWNVPGALVRPGTAVGAAISSLRCLFFLSAYSQDLTRRCCVIV